MRLLRIQLAGLIIIIGACAGRDARDEALNDADTSLVAEAADDVVSRRGSSKHGPGDGSARLVERTVIGLLEHGPEDWFQRISAIAVDRLGRLYVADSYAQNVRVFDSRGAHVRTLGRRGRGPGEFQSPQGLTWQNDSTLWIVDFFSNRYSIYDTSGVHIRDVRRPPIGSLYPWHARFDGGNLIEPRIGGHPRHLLALDPAAPFASRMNSFPYPLTGVPLDEWNPSVYVQAGSTVWREKVPFTEGFEWIIDGRGGVWIGDTREYRLVRRSLAGDTLLVISRDIQGAEISAEERRAAIDALGPSVPPRDHSRIPDRKPAFRMIIPCDDGGVWLVREGEGTAWWVDVLDAQGRTVATVELPVEPDLDVLPVVTESDLWVVTRGALDVPFVVRLTAE